MRQPSRFWLGGALGSLFFLLGSLLVFTHLASAQTAGTTDPKTDCTSKGYSWCQPSGGGSSYCTYTTSPCPAYDATSCQAQNGQWCSYQSGTTGGWCATNGATCPINDEAGCTAASRNWCKSPAGMITGGWCATAGQKCPANTETDCAAQSGKWCKNTDGTTGWCSSDKNYVCPAYNQTDCTTQGKKWCVSPGSTTGWCTDNCPYTTTADPKTECTSKNYKWCTPAGGGAAYCNNSTTMNCPAYTETDCAAQSGKWCKNSDGTTGSCSSDKNYVCPAYTEADCKIQGKIWCTNPTGGTNSSWCTDNCPYTGVGQTVACTDSDNGRDYFKKGVGTGIYAGAREGYHAIYGLEPNPTTPKATTNQYSTFYDHCATDTQLNEAFCDSATGKLGAYGMSCQYGCSNGACNSPPASDEKTKCTTGGGKWCKNSDGASGWCSNSTNPCPAYDETSCKAQSGEWCKSSAGATSAGWCATGGSSCPISDASACQTKGRQWCKYQSGTGGWCAASNEKCPVYSETECVAQKGDWCVSAQGGTGWCSYQTGSCPVNDKTTCEKKNRKWCTNNYGGGWCAMTDQSCGGITTMNWPNSEDMCNKYYGLWCPSETSNGYCTMQTKKCFLLPKAGYMICWDNSQAPSGSTCPALPTTETDCVKIGKNWCKSMTTYSSNATTATTGWCSADPCYVMPPTGKILCPDGASVATILDECPKRTVTIDYKTCPDGAQIKKDQTCPEKSYVCRNGQKVKDLADCPKDDIEICLSSGGKWCSSAEGSGQGHCAVTGSSCAEIKKEPLDQTEIVRYEAKKKELLNKLTSLTAFFTAQKDKTSLGKISDLQDQLKALSFTTRDDVRNFETSQEEVKLLEILRKETLDGADTESERDQELQTKALQEMKRGLIKFEQFLLPLSLKRTRLQKSGVRLPSEWNNLLNKAEEILPRGKKAKTYEEMVAIYKELLTIGPELNDLGPRLNKLTRLPRVLPLLNRYLARSEPALGATTAQIKRLKLDLTEELGQLTSLFSDAKNALTTLRDGSYPEDTDIFEYIQQNIIDTLEEFDNQVSYLQALFNTKKYITQADATVRRYDTLIKRALRRKQNVTAAQTLFKELKSEVAKLRTLATTKVSDKTVDDILDLMKSIASIGAALDKELGVAISQLEQQLKQTLEGNGPEKVDLLQLNELEKLSVRSYLLANFYRSKFTPLHNLATLY